MTEVEVRELERIYWQLFDHEAELQVSVRRFENTRERIAQMLLEHRGKVGPREV